MPSQINCLALSEIISEKIRACYQRNKARDIYDLSLFASMPLDQTLIRRLVVLKLWQSRDSFDPNQLMQKFKDEKVFDWNDLSQLLRRNATVDLKKITTDCCRGYQFLFDLTEEERHLADDPYQREYKLWQKLRANVHLTRKQEK